MIVLLNHSRCYCLVLKLCLCYFFLPESSVKRARLVGRRQLNKSSQREYEDAIAGVIDDDIDWLGYVSKEENASSRLSSQSNISLDTSSDNEDLISGGAVAHSQSRK